MERPSRREERVLALGQAVVDITAVGRWVAERDALRRRAALLGAAGRWTRLLRPGGGASAAASSTTTTAAASGSDCQDREGQEEGSEEAEQGVGLAEKGGKGDDAGGRDLHWGRRRCLSWVG